MIVVIVVIILVIVVIVAGVDILWLSRTLLYHILGLSRQGVPIFYKQQNKLWPIFYKQ